MSNVLQCGFLVRSHLTLLARIEAALAARGHDVTNALMTSQSSTTCDFDLRDVRIHRCPPHDLLRGPMLSIADMRDPERCVSLFKAWLLEGLGQRVEFVRRVIDERKPAVILCDAMSVEGVVAAERSGIPWIGVSSTLVHMTPRDDADPYERTLEVYEPMAAEAMRQFGVTGRMRGGEIVSPTHTIMAATREWASIREPNQTLSGYLVDTHFSTLDVPRRFPEWPLVVVSFGSYLYLATEFIANFAQAAEGMEVEFLVSARNFVRDYRGKIPPNFVCSDSIPQVAALRQASLLITHGGANSILEAVSHAVPVLVLPLAFEQFRNAELVKRLGVGSTLDARTVTPSDVRDGMEDALSPGRRETLARRRRELADATAADLLQSIVPFLE